MSQGHIRPQGEGSWEIKFDLGRDPITGRRITKYATFRGTKRQAQQELTRLLARSPGRTAHGGAVPRDCREKHHSPARPRAGTQVDPGPHRSV
jgi:hypothetical protein